MKCPHCENVQKITWKAYWCAPFGRYKCSACGLRFKLKRNFSHLIILILCASAGVGLSLLLHSMLISLAAYIAFAFLIIFPLDRWLDERKETKKL